MPGKREYLAGETARRVRCGCGTCARAASASIKVVLYHAHAEKISAGIALALKQMTDRGWDNDVCYIRPDKAAVQTVERHLASANYDCVAIGAVSACLLRVLRTLRRLLTRSIGPLDAARPGQAHA
jgi:hypothetical protein